MKSPKIVEVSGNDGGGLYINGKLVSGYFTCGQSDIVKALGFKNWESRQLDQVWYDSIVNLPERLSQCQFIKK